MNQESLEIRAAQWKGGKVLRAEEKNYRGSESPPFREAKHEAAVMISPGFTCTDITLAEVTQ